mgnify:CR=1 FL=1
MRKVPEKQMNEYLISFVVLSYNQELFIGDAIRSALDQDYQPVEIIISDDCSSDKTYEIITNIISTYKGPNTVKINRNSRTLGISKHLSYVMKRFVSGGLVFLAAGDDISCSERVSLCVREWQKRGCPSCLFSNAQIIDEHGVVHGLWLSNPSPILTLRDFEKTGRAWTLGCTNVVDKNLFSKYGDISSKVIQEDGVIAFRALLENGISYIDRPLVMYRRHKENVYDLNDSPKRLKLAARSIYMHSNWFSDYRKSGIKNVKVLFKIVYRISGDIFHLYIELLRSVL